MIEYNIKDRAEKICVKIENKTATLQDFVQLLLILKEQKISAFKYNDLLIVKIY